MKYFYLGAIWTAQIAYVFFTLLSVMPDNPVKVQFLNYTEIFEHVFYQKWTFFAPPPQSVTGVVLLVDFRDQSRPDNKQVYNLTEKLDRLKKENFPFSWKENFQQYLLSGPAITDARMHGNLEKKLTNLKDLTSIDEVTLQEYRRISMENKKMYRSSNTLKQYCIQAVKAMDIGYSEGNAELRYVVTDKVIPKYIDRYADEEPSLKILHISAPF